MTDTKVTIKRKFQGTVVSDKMDKTVVVRVIRAKVHEKYGKHYKSTQKYHAHDEQNQYHVGDEVEIQEVRPMARTKKWKVVKKVK